jgi:release factor glutamine methyltransferase
VNKPEPPQLGFQLTISDEKAEQIRRWHERAYREALAEGSTTRTFDYLGLSVVVPPGVQPITPVSHLLGEAVVAEAGNRDLVLDMGTGSGINGILAASRGARVVAVDTNPRALKAARANAEHNGVADRIEVRHSDVFSAVEGAFDLIIFDPPFRWFAPRDDLEAAMTDENYRAMTTFFHEARQHLSPAGRMLIFFGTSGDIGYLEKVIATEGFHAEVIADQRLSRGDAQVEYFTFRVT